MPPGNARPRWGAKFRGIRVWDETSGRRRGVLQGVLLVRLARGVWVSGHPTRPLLHAMSCSVLLAVGLNRGMRQGLQPVPVPCC